MMRILIKHIHTWLGYNKKVMFTHVFLLQSENGFKVDLMYRSNE